MHHRARLNILQMDRSTQEASMTRSSKWFAAALPVIFLAGCSLEYHGDKYFAAKDHWTYGGSYVIGYRDRNGDRPLNGSGFSYYGRYRVEKSASSADGIVR
jgi:hypothetical protein